MSEINPAELVQGSDEWIAYRLGKLTGSNIPKILAKRKDGKPSEMRATHASDLIIERMTKRPINNFKSDDMLWGNEKEPEARAEYAFLNDVEVEQVGFVDHPTIPMAGCSPDGLVICPVRGKHTVQFKCPKSKTHIAQLREKKVDPDYYKQIQWELACLPGYVGCDFVSYDPRVEIKPLWRQWIPRNDQMIAEMEAEAIKFLADVEKAVNELEAEYGQKAAA